MYLLELQAAFKVVAGILNSRPVYARWGSRGGNDTDFLSALTPNMMLLGRANVGLPVRDYDRSDKPLLRIKYVEECIAQWWNQFQTQHFSSLVPRQKWLFEKRNMQVGDVVLLMYEGKCKPGSYRLAVVRDIEVSSDDLVRTVLVEYSLVGDLPYGEREKYLGITKKKVVVPVQRLVLILPVEEQIQFGGRADMESVPLDEVRGRSGYGMVHLGMWSKLRRCSQGHFLVAEDPSVGASCVRVGFDVRWSLRSEVSSRWSMVQSLLGQLSCSEVDAGIYGYYAEKIGEEK